MQSEHIVIGNLKEHFEHVDKILDDYMFRLNITGKNALRFSLLAEEAVRLAKSIIDDNESVEMWFEGDARVSVIFIKVKSHMDANRKEEFISVSTEGENSAEVSFFDTIKSIFVKPEKPTWSLAEYEADLRLKREEDKYALEAWDNLERSLLASLASNIYVEAKDDGMLMMIQKDFTKSLEAVTSGKSSASTSQIFFNNKDKNVEGTMKKLDNSIEVLNLSKKDMLHVKLVMEEIVSMMKAMTGEFTAAVWAEKYKNVCEVRLIAKTQMSHEKKTELLSVSSNKKNALAKGFMGKVRDIIETELLAYEDVIKAEQEYGSPGMYYERMGSYYNMVSSGFSMMGGGYMWSLVDYRDNLDKSVKTSDEHQEAWDELEKSIIANIAKDVIVGVKKDMVEMRIIIDIMGE